MDLSWTAATDDVGVSGYDVYRNGSLIESIPPGTTYADLSVSPRTSYTYQIVARDGAGNVSPFSNVAAVTTPEIFTDDFESGTLAKWTSVSGLANQSSVVDSGAYAARATSDGTAGASAQTTLDSTVGELYYRMRFNVLSQGPNSVSLARLRTAANGALASVFIANTGKLSYRNDTNATVTTTNQVVSKNLWHELQFHVLLNGDSSQVDLWLDGVQVITAQTDSLGTSPFGRVELGDPSAGRAFDVAFDNVVLGPSFLTDTTAPSAPANLHATIVLANEVDLAWDPATDDVGVITYRVYRDGAPIADVDGSLGSYADTTAVDSTQYTYTVTALDAVNHESVPSNALVVTTLDGTKPTAPASLTAAPKPGVNEIDLSWSPATDNVGVAHYNVYRDGGAVPLTTVDGTTLSYADTAVLGSTTHSYTVTALDAANNEGLPSNTATATSWDTVKPNAPTLLTASPLSDHEISLTWSAATDNVGVTGYKVYRNGATPAIATLGNVTTFTDATAPAATASSYTVSALDAAGNESVVSNSLSATTYLFTDGFESGNLSKWTSVSGLAVTNAIHHTGLWGAQAQSQKNTADFASKTLPSTYTELYYRAWFQTQTGKPDTVNLLRLQTATGVNLVSVFYDSNRRLAMRDDVTNASVSSTSSLSPGTWYEAKVHLIINGNSGSVEVFLNGTKIAALSGTRNFGTVAIGRAILGENTTGHAYNVAFDDVWISRTAS